jgi:hypothetical protein
MNGPISAERILTTARQHEIRGEVDDLFDASDRIVHSILHAIHAQAIKGVTYEKGDDGIYRAPKAETAQGSPVAEETVVASGALATEEVLVELPADAVPTDLQAAPVQEVVPAA